MPKEVDYLSNWSTLNQHVQKLDEATIADLLKKEKKGKRRTQFLLRLYGRFNILRTARERQELISK